MGAYEGFAEVYDVFMDDVDYDNWVDYIEKIWNMNNLKPKLIAELGCGTGNVTERLGAKGYDMIGIDISEDMLAEAREKSMENQNGVLYLLQDMREFELYGTVDTIISLFDSLNYITEENDLLKVFKLVNNYLEPEGIFIFDLNTKYKFQSILADNTFTQTNEDSAYIWENYYDDETEINEYYMNIFVEGEDGRYERFEEVHYEKAYSIDTVTQLLEKSGLKLINIYDAYTFDEPKENSERLFFVAQEQGKRL